MQGQQWWGPLQRLWGQEQRLWGASLVVRVARVARGTAIMDHQLPTATPRLHMVTPLRPTGIMDHGLLILIPLRFTGIRILITHRGTIPGTGTMVITVEGATMDIAGRPGQA